MKTTTKYWWVVFLLLIATSLSFLDRQVLSIVIIKIKEDLFISDVEYGFINSGFLASYAIMFTLGGVLIDKYGSRLGLAVSVGFWSFATVLHSFAGSVFQFATFRFLLGIGEGGCFPGAVRAVIEWVPKTKHSLANGIAIGGSALGAVIAPPLCAYFLGFWDWRYIFIMTGAFGFVWLVAWLIITKKNELAEAPSKSEVAENRSFSFIKVLKSREALIFMAMRFVLDPILYFYMFWIPKYLNESHGLAVDKIGQLLWIPFLALGVANVTGGWVSDFIFQKTAKEAFSRQVVMGFAALMTLPVAAIGLLNSYVVILVLVGLAFFAHGLWITNYITSIGDVFGKTASSTVVGLSGSAGALSSLVLNPVIGLIISTYSYDSVWIYCGLMYPVVFIGYMIFTAKKKSAAFTAA
ncbi:MFS transporter [Imperialibacter roseus]|uniref:MFS transporter n=1 Tax=Imperialibacter roseus TaxID=1324217 RepID=A0ABZ0IVQ0_9BACT|nr:MFS transporter [Imperialibacter roseus]WOK08592.1 MFS transporter [Imperialibacter roseus]